jgi:cob(I)alamin adenosyltransferase
LKHVSIGKGVQLFGNMRISEQACVASPTLRRLRLLLLSPVFIEKPWDTFPKPAQRRRVMVVLNRIYTRTGDAGTTALGNGVRRPKYDLRVAAYGTVDETNAAIGIARLSTAIEAPDVDPMLLAIQNDLFDLGADLCVPAGAGEEPGRSLRIVQSQVDRLERDIDLLNAELAPLRSFILPGGSAAAAALHLARTFCRRAERKMVELAQRPDETVGEPALKYVNRLSDFLFVAARFTNGKGAGDILWRPGQHR